MTTREGMKSAVGRAIGALGRSANQPQFERLAGLLRFLRPTYGMVGTRDVDVARQQREIDEALSILSSPDHLARRQ